MKTRYRIGYPYANPSPEKLRDVVVVLEPNNYAGYREVRDSNHNIYVLPSSDPGPPILNLCHHGVSGTIIEQNDHSKTSIAQNGRINGAGVSMQLALVLAAFAQYEHNKAQNLPLVLLSAAIAKPIGAPPFLDATIKTYCDANEVEEDIIKKYNAAKMAKAVALVLPTRDAHILSQKLQQKVNDITIFRQQLSNEKPCIVAADDVSLPQLAAHLGICKFHYTSSKKRTSLSRKLVQSLLITFAATCLFWWPWVSPKDLKIHDENFNAANYQVTYFANSSQIDRFPQHANAQLVPNSNQRKLYISLKVKQGDINAAVFFAQPYQPTKHGALYALTFKATALCNQATVGNDMDHNGRLYFYFALEQDGKIYITNKAHELLLNDFRICEETATQNNFKEFANSYLHTNESVQPDFSASGSQIKYGFIFFGGTKSTAYIGTCGYVEKWSVTIKRSKS
ncbi:hypothetical protein [Candidatus Uabimicrobium amorphum]|uniref:Uncharacterized protein n=1 Tax=Uabimicrobium amorphum TaxID=2596890 RepID=A0A5S9F1F6_UABAM|nr:hypothetical protein [Candidatus Uabimicrobium amorphum]BBM82352.1 hypothetical protein UABAM_00695 [Candidatus Uabimicrobium amorphum]